VEGSCEHGNEPWGFHKMLAISWVAAELAAPPEGLSSMSPATISGTGRMLILKGSDDDVRQSELLFFLSPSIVLYSEEQ
jgi:hypothetical protein